MKKLLVTSMLALAAAAAIADNPHGVPPGIAKKLHEARCNDCGVVQDTHLEKRKGEGGAVGIVAGAAAGGLLGNQFGKGNGKTALTVAGAVGGGFAGNEVQKRVTAKEIWVTTVKFHDGSVRRFEQEAAPAWKAGAVVKVRGSALSLHAS
jgi:outer membrane lipoprotein SlyB